MIHAFLCIALLSQQVILHTVPHSDLSDISWDLWWRVDTGFSSLSAIELQVYLLDSAPPLIGPPYSHGGRGSFL